MVRTLQIPLIITLSFVVLFRFVLILYILPSQSFVFPMDGLMKFFGENLALTDY